MSDGASNERKDDRSAPTRSSWRSAGKTVLVVAALGACLVWAQGNMRQARVDGAESGAIGRLRSIWSAQRAYREAHGEYAADVAQLASSGWPHVLPVSAGYRFVVSREGESWWATAVPTGGDVYDDGALPLTKHFHLDSEGVIREEDGRLPTAASPVRFPAPRPAPADE